MVTPSPVRSPDAIDILQMPFAVSALLGISAADPDGAAWCRKRLSE
jgi:hypothetical protein